MSREPNKGEIWQEVDPRFNRFIRILELTDDEILVQTCNAQGEITKGSRVTRPVAERFNGKIGGYRFVSDGMTQSKPHHHKRGQNE